MIFEVKRESKDTSTKQFYEANQVLGEVVAAMIHGEVVTVTPDGQQPGFEPAPFA